MSDFQEYELLEPGVPAAGDRPATDADADVDTESAAPAPVDEDDRAGGESDDSGDGSGGSGGLRRHFRSGGFANDTAWSLLHDVTQLLVMTATFTLLGRSLGKSDYGRYAGMYGIIGPIGGLTWSGICLAVLQRRLRERDGVETTARNFFLAAITLAVLSTIAATGIGTAIIHGLGAPTIFLMAFAELFASALNYVAFSMIQADRGFAPSTRLRMVTLLIRVSVVLALSATGNLRIAPLAAGYAIGFLIYGIVIWRRVLPHYRIPILFGRPQPGIGKLTALISIPIGAGVLQQDGDKAVLNAYHHAASAGLYGAAFRIISMGLVPLRALEGAAFQRFLPHNESEINQHTRRAARYSALALAGSVLVGIGIYIASPLATAILGDDFKGAQSIIPWLMPFLPLTAVSNAPLNGLLGLGKLGLRAGIYSVSALLSLTLYITMIPLVPQNAPWKGAIIGTIVGEAFLAITGWTALRHCQAKHNATVIEARETVPA